MKENLRRLTFFGEVNLRTPFEGEAEFEKRIYFSSEETDLLIFDYTDCESSRYVFYWEETARDDPLSAEYCHLGQNSVNKFGEWLDEISELSPEYTNSDIYWEKNSGFDNLVSSLLEVKGKTDYSLEEYISDLENFYAIRS
jgi:hypothetical protein